MGSDQRNPSHMEPGTQAVDELLEDEDLQLSPKVAQLLQVTDDAELTLAELQELTLANIQELAASFEAAAMEAAVQEPLDTEGLIAMTEVRTRFLIATAVIAEIDLDEGDGEDFEDDDLPE